MEPTILPEYECQICFDLLIEPCTTMCGHSFCKTCFIKFLDNNHTCPTCRKPIFQTKETLSKSFILENIIKAKYPQKYSEGLAQRLKVIDNQTTTQYFQIPFIQLDNTYIWPMITKTIVIYHNVFYNTLNIASLNDRRIVIIPSLTQSQNGMICSLCEIVKLNTIDNALSVTFKGVKRFKLQSVNGNAQEVNDANYVFVSKGELVDDAVIEDDEAKAEVYNKIKQINTYNDDILKRAPISFVNALNRQYGKQPVVPLLLSQLSQMKIEEISMYFLHIIKADFNTKMGLYQGTNILERVNWILEQYTSKESIKNNPSFPIMFYSIETNDQFSLHYNCSNTVLLFVVFIIIGFLIKFKIIRN